MANGLSIKRLQQLRANDYLNRPTAGMERTSFKKESGWRPAVKVPQEKTTHGTPWHPVGDGRAGLVGVGPVVPTLEFLQCTSAAQGHLRERHLVFAARTSNRLQRSSAPALSAYKLKLWPGYPFVAQEQLGRIVRPRSPGPGQSHIPLCGPTVRLCAGRHRAVPVSQGADISGSSARTRSMMD